MARSICSVLFDNQLQRTELWIMNGFKMIPNFYPADHRIYLREELHLRQSRRPQYSMRAFARDLEMSPSFLCEFLAGRQGLSKERVLWISKKLSLSTEQCEHFWDLVEAKFGRTAEAKKSADFRVLQKTKNEQNHLSLERFHVIADWYHFPLLEILGLPNSDYTFKELSTILGISEITVVEAVERMKTVGLLEEETTEFGTTKYNIKSEYTLAGDEGANRAIQIAHQQFLNMQSRCVDTKPITERENLDVTFRLTQTDWDSMCNELRSAIMSVIAKYADSKAEKDQVVCFTMQMVSLLNSKAEGVKYDN